jgi:preprotein translocase subunit SecD
MGTTEPLIQRQGEDRILIQVPGLGDTERLKAIIGKTAKMTFHMVDMDCNPAGRIPLSSRLVPSDEVGPDGQPFNYCIEKRVRLTGQNLVDAQPTFQDGQPVVSFRFDTRGAQIFGRITADNVGKLFAIVLDGKVITAPRIESPILGGSGIIRGSFTVQSARDLSILLRAGALPASMIYLEERSVGPGLGQDSIDSGKLASVLGLVLIVIFMFVAYGLFGLMANIALLFNIALILGLLSLLQATLTLPGIAGIALTMGMAVDANVLIFERMREEVRNGRSPFNAVDAGYRRALTTIIDSNLTTLIAAVLLFAFGSGPIKGFGVTLTIGIVTSMFTAIMVTRFLVVTWLRQKRPQALPI